MAGPIQSVGLDFDTCALHIHRSSTVKRNNFSSERTLVTGEGALKLDLIIHQVKYGATRKIKSLSSIQGNFLLCWSNSGYRALAVTLSQLPLQFVYRTCQILLPFFAFYNIICEDAADKTCQTAGGVKGAAIRGCETLYSCFLSDNATDRLLYHL